MRVNVICEWALEGLHLCPHMIHHCRVQVTKLRLLHFNEEIERRILILTDIFQTQMPRLPWSQGNGDVSNSISTLESTCPTILVTTNIKWGFVKNVMGLMKIHIIEKEKVSSRWRLNKSYCAGLTFSGIYPSTAWGPPRMMDDSY